MSRRLIHQLRVVGFGEGLSFLLLLGVAMPLKYLAGRPEAVRALGSIHGVLFLLYLVAVVRAGRGCRWPVALWGAALLAAVIPCGPFVLDRKLRREESGPPPGGPARDRAPG